MTLRVHIVQCKPNRENPQENWLTVKRIIHQTESDILVFPELMTTGYCYENKTELDKYAVQHNDPQLAEIQELATKLNRIICLGYAERHGIDYFNSAALIMPNAAQTRTYRKTHLFYKERYVFSEGDSGFFVVRDDARDCRIGVMICYDWRFPESARTLTLLGADIILCPSNLVTKIWRAVMPTRAIENKVYLAVANRYGTEYYENEEVTFNGQSALYDVNGELLAAADAEGDVIVNATIDPLRTRDKSFNSINDILQDRRPKHYLS